MCWGKSTFRRTYCQDRAVSNPELPHKERLPYMLYIFLSISPSLRSDMYFPTNAKILSEQPSQKPADPWRKVLGIWTNKLKKAFIPGYFIAFKSRLLVATYSGYTGHRRIYSTRDRIREHFWWDSLEMDTKQFVLSCFHCHFSVLGNVVPRVPCYTTHSTAPNKIIHFF